MVDMHVRYAETRASTSISSSKSAGRAEGKLEGLATPRASSARSLASGKGRRAKLIELVREHIGQLKHVTLRPAAAVHA
jgi:hypothetical protein